MASKNAFGAASRMLAALSIRALQRCGRAKPGSYVCQACAAQFTFKSGKLLCPKCRSTAADDLVPFYTEEDPEKHEMLGVEAFTSG